MTEDRHKELLRKHYPGFVGDNPAWKWAADTYDIVCEDNADVIERDVARFLATGEPRTDIGIRGYAFDAAIAWYPDSSEQAFFIAAVEVAIHVRLEEMNNG